MIKEGKIGVQEATFLVVIAISNRIFFSAPNAIQRAVGTGGWYMSLLSCVESILFFTFIYLLLRRFPGKDILEIFNLVFGKCLGVIFSFLYSISFLLAGGILLREFIDILKIFIFAETPISFLAGSAVLIIMVLGFLGLETIARVSRIAGLTLVFGLVVLLIMPIPEYRLENLFPILGYGIGTTLYEGITRSAAYSEIIILAVIAGSLQGAKHIKKVGYASLVMSGIIISTTFLCIQLLFPYYFLQELVSPLYAMARSINYGVFFQRMDPIFLFLWIIISVISGSILFYCAVSSYCKAFNMDDLRPCITPAGIVLLTVIFFPRDFSSIVLTYIEMLRIGPVLLFYILPLITLITSVIRKKKGTVAREEKP